MTEREHHLIYVPGLNDTLPSHRMAAFVLTSSIWRIHGFRGHTFKADWSNHEEDIDQKVDRLLLCATKLTNMGHSVSLVGQSAGGSLAVNALFQRPDIFNNIINIAGRLRSFGTPSLEESARGFPVFADSVSKCDVLLKTAKTDVIRRVVTVRPEGDNVVPPETVGVDGACNIISPIKGHTKGGSYIAAIDAAMWMDLIKET